MSELLDVRELARIEGVIDTALHDAIDEIEAVVAVERGEIDQPFWYVRLAGETKQHFSAEFTLGQRTLAIESYFMPDPDENREAVFSHLLVRNRAMHGLHFVIGPEDSVYLRGQLDNRNVDADAIDRRLAAVYEYTEQYFVPAMRLGFESQFKPVSVAGRPKP